MRYLIVLFMSFYQVDSAFAQDPQTIDIKLVEQQLEKMSKLTVFSLRLPTHIVRSFTHTVNEPDNSPLSCDLTFASQREKVNLDYSCDPTRTLRTESLNLAAN